MIRRADIIEHTRHLSEEFTVFGLHFGRRSEIFFPRPEIREFWGYFDMSDNQAVGKLRINIQ